MNKKYLFIAIVIAIVFIMPGLKAEELIARSGGRYISSRIELVAEASDNMTIEIQSASGLRGRIEITTEDGDRAGFEYRKLIKAGDEKTAREYAGEIDVAFENRAGVVRLLLKAPNPEPWSGTDNSVQIEGKLTIPIGCRVSIDGPYFDFAISGPMTELNCKPSFGRYVLNDIDGKINMTMTGGNVNARNIGGDVNIKGENSEIRIVGLSADKQARIQNQGGDITLNDLSGNVEVKNSYGKIKIENATADNGQLKIYGEFCPIDLGLISLNNANISIDNENDNVKIFLPDTSSAVFNLSVGVDSEINVTDIPVKPGRIEPKFMELTAGDGNSVISADINGVGDITIAGMK